MTRVLVMELQKINVVIINYLWPYSGAYEIISITVSLVRFMTLGVTEIASPPENRAPETFTTVNDSITKSLLRMSKFLPPIKYN